jgi:hypothetical protein
MQLEGDLQSTQLPVLLRTVSALSTTGILTVQSEQDMLAVTFLEGRIVSADAMNQTMEEGLGQVLESQGLVAPETFSRLAEEQQSTGDRLVDLLLKKRLVRRQQLLEAIRLQTYRLLLRLLTWRDGEYNIFVGDEISYEDGIEPISVEELLVRAAGDLGVDGPVSGPIPEVDVAFEPVEDDRTVQVLGRDGEERPSPDSVWLTPAEVEVLKHTTGGRAGVAIVEGTGLDRYQVRFALHRLLQENLVRSAYERSEVKRPSPAPRPERPSGHRPTPLTMPEIRLPASGLTPPTSFLRSEVDARVRADQRPSVELFDSELPGAPPAARVEERARKPEAERATGQETLSEVAHVWLARSFALVLFVLTLVAVIPRSSRHSVFLPFPWQGSQRSQLESEQRAILYRKVDSASRIYYLLFGRFPEEMEILVDFQLLAAIDLYDPRGHWLAFSATDVGYTLLPLKDGVPVPGFEATGDIVRDFFLDPQFVELERERTRRPLFVIRD